MKIIRWSLIIFLIVGCIGWCTENIDRHDTERFDNSLTTIVEIHSMSRENVSSLYKSTIKTILIPMNDFYYIIDEDIPLDAKIYSIERKIKRIKRLHYNHDIYKDFVRDLENLLERYKT